MLQTQVKGSRISGRSLVCIRVWCIECLMDFVITDQVERSIDDRQLLIEVKPANGPVIIDVSKRSH